MLCNERSMSFSSLKAGTTIEIFRRIVNVTSEVITGDPAYANRHKCASGLDSRQYESVKKSGVGDQCRGRLTKGEKSTISSLRRPLIERQRH
jgi:hypothetical protein